MTRVTCLRQSHRGDSAEFKLRPCSSHPLARSSGSTLGGVSPTTIAAASELDSRVTALGAGAVTTISADTSSLTVYPEQIIYYLCGEGGRAS